MLAQLIKNQGEVVTQLSRQIDGSQGPAANVMRTPIVGDGKSSQTAGLNSSNQAQRIQARHTPQERTIGKKTASMYTPATIHPDELKILKFTAPLAGGLAAVKGIVDSEQGDSFGRGIPSSLAIGGLAGIGMGVAHKILYPNTFSARGALGYGVTGLLSAPVAYSVAYGIDRLATKLPRISDMFAPRVSHEA